MVLKMSTWWGLMILLGCKILHTLQSTCSDKSKLICAPVGGRVRVPCPSPSTHDVQFNLFKDGEEIHDHRCKEGNASKGHRSANRVDVEYNRAENGSFDFMLKDVNASSHGLYRCEGTIMFPPPLKTLPSTPGILLLIEGHQCNNCTNKTPEVSSGFGWLWIFTLMVSSYSVVVTMAAIVYWVKRRKDDSRSAYVNTNPKTTHKTKGRLYNPKPRYFYAPD